MPYWATVSQTNPHVLFNVRHPASIWNLWLPLSSLPAWIHRDVNGHLCEAVISACCHSHAGIEGFSHVCGRHEHNLLVWLSDSDMHMTITEVYVKEKKGKRMCMKWGSCGCCLPKNTQFNQFSSDWQLLKLCKLYICLLSSCEIICSLFRGTCFMSENNVVCLMISLSISSSKRCFRHMYSLFPLSVLFYSMNAICQVETRIKWGQHMGPQCVCVSDFFLLFILGN